MYIPEFLRLNFTVDIPELCGPSTANKQLSDPRCHKQGKKKVLQILQQTANILTFHS